MYRWMVLDTKQVIKLTGRPKAGAKGKVHVLRHPELGVVAIKFLGPVSK